MHPKSTRRFLNSPWLGAEQFTRQKSFLTKNNSVSRSLRLSLVRGYWTQWTSWTQTCRSGNQARSRTCVNPLPESGLELVCSDWADTEKRSCLGSNGSKRLNDCNVAFIWVGAQRSDVLELSHNQEVYYISFKFYHCDFRTIYNIFVLFSWTGATSSSSSTSPMSSFTMPSTMSSGTISSSHFDVTPSSSPASGSRSLSQLRFSFIFFFILFIYSILNLQR